MNEESPQVQIAQSVGRLEGVIGELKDTLNGYRDDMKEKINKEQGELIAQNVVGGHVDEYHKSSDPEIKAKKLKATLNVVGPFLLRYILPLLAAGGVGTWWASQQNVVAPTPEAVEAPADINE